MSVNVTVSITAESFELICLTEFKPPVIPTYMLFITIELHGYDGTNVIDTALVPTPHAINELHLQKMSRTNERVGEPLRINVRRYLRTQGNMVRTSVETESRERSV